MNNELRKELEAAGKSVMDEVGRMESNGILPLVVKFGDVVTETITAESLRSTLDDIMKSKLKIAVCGVVKAGKSTFLNSILFGRDVLPTFPTPCTAKLTFITHTDGESGFTAKFFSREEFQMMKAELADDARAKLDVEIARAQTAGVSPMQLWGTEQNVGFDSPDELRDRLRQYASEEGCFTPFVKEILLKIDRPELKGLFVVDTPGLDDPNPLNSLETERWAQNAHAVIYLMPWRGMSAKDKEFVERNFGKLSASSVNRMFVITRIDQDEKWPDTMALFKKEFPSEASNICGYSAKADLMLKAKSAGATLTEDEEFLVKKWQRDGFRHDPSDVRSMVARRIFEGGGEGGAKFRIMQLRAQIGRCYEMYIANWRKEKEAIKESIKVLKLERDAAQRNADNLRSLNERLQGRCEDLRIKAKNSFANGNQFTKADETVSKILTRTARIVDNGFATCLRDAQILPILRTAKLDVETAMRKEAGGFLERKIQYAQQALTFVADEIKTASIEVKCDDCIREPDMLPLVDKGKALLSDVKLSIDFGKIDECIHWYRKTETNKIEVKAAFEERAKEISESIYEKANSFELFARSAIDVYISETLKNIDSKIGELHEAALASPDEKKQLLSDREKDLKEAIERCRVGEDAYASFDM